MTPDSPQVLEYRQDLAGGVNARPVSDNDVSARLCRPFRGDLYLWGRRSPVGLAAWFAWALALRDQRTGDVSQTVPQGRQLTNQIRATTGYRSDLNRCQEASTRIVGVGVAATWPDSRRRSGLGLAEHLGLPATELRFAGEASAFADMLHHLLAGK